MFLDTMEPSTENKNSSLEKTVLIIWTQICGKIAEIVHKMTLKKIIVKFRPQGGKLCVTQFATHFTHVSR